MVNKVIAKDVDIYTYPDEFDDNPGAVTIGDLHGNVVKLLHFLLRQNILKFKDGINNQRDLYDKFVNLYEKNSEISELYLEKTGDITAKSRYIEEHQNTINKYTRLIGNTTDNDKINEYKAQIERSVNFRDGKITEKKAIQIELDKAILDADLPGQLNEFNVFLSLLEINDKSVLVRLIGDELADRGGNDYFTLRLLDFLHRQGVKVTITISNHSNEFITAYENLFKKEGLVPLNDIGNKQKPSFFGLKLLYEQELVSQKEIKKLVNTAYKPTLKILDYTLSETGITLFSHAPVRFDVIKAIATHLGVIYNDSSKEALSETIDKINIKFAEIVKKNQVRDFCSLPDKTEIRSEDMSKEEIKIKPLVHIIWNRWNESKDTVDARPSLVNNFEVTYCHGHDSCKSKYAHIINLDTLCGKQSQKKQGEAVKEAEQYPDDPQAKEYLKDLLCYKILKSDEFSLSLKQTVTQGNPTVPSLIKTGMNALFLFGAVAIGLALVATAIFAPFSVSILGTVALLGTLVAGLTFIAGAFGFGVAKVEKVMTVNTSVVSKNVVNNMTDKNELNHTARALSKMGGTFKKDEPNVPDELSVIQTNMIDQSNLDNEQIDVNNTSSTF